MEHRPKRDFIVGIFVLAGIGAIGYLSVSVGGFSWHEQGGLRLSAGFDETGGLHVRAPVVVAGVRVGEVSGISLDKNNRARVDMNLEPTLELPTDTSASIVTAGVLGDRYIELAPGGDDRMLKSGDRITLTENAVILERLIGKLIYGVTQGAKSKPDAPATALSEESHARSKEAMPMRRLMYVGVSVCAGLMLAVGALAQNDGAASGTALDAVHQIVDQALAVLRNTKLSPADKRAQFRAVAYEHMDFQTLSRMTLGQHWRELSDAQRGQFVEEFKLHVANTYSHITDDYTDEDVTITGDRPEERGDWTVLTKIVGTNKDGTRQDVAKVDYRLRQKEGRWKVIDISIEGVSMAVNFRDQFQEIMADGGIDRLVHLLRDKNAAADK